MALPLGYSLSCVIRKAMSVPQTRKSCHLMPPVCTGFHRITFLRDTKWLIVYPNLPPQVQSYLLLTHSLLYNSLFVAEIGIFTCLQRQFLVYLKGKSDIAGKVISKEAIEC